MPLPTVVSSFASCIHVSFYKYANIYLSDLLLINIKYFLAIMNNSAAHILVHKCAYLCISIGYVTGCKNASFIGNLIFSFSRYYQIVLQNGCSNWYPQTAEYESGYCTFSPTIAVDSYRVLGSLLSYLIVAPLLTGICCCYYY